MRIILFLFLISPLSFAQENLSVTGQVCQRIVDRDPVGGDHELPFEMINDNVALWTRLTSGKLSRIRHVWFKDNTPLAILDLVLFPPLNRAYSTKRIYEVGNYRVEVQTPDKILISTFKFKVTDSPNGKWVEPDQGNNSPAAQNAQPAPPPLEPRKSTDGPIKPLPQAEPAPVTPPEQVVRRTTDGPIKPLESPPEAPKAEEKPKVIERPAVKFVRGIFWNNARTNFINLGLIWSPHYRSGVFGLRGNFGGEEQKGRAAGNAELLWIWILNGQNEIEVGGGFQNWNGTTSPMFSGNFIIKADLWLGLHVDTIYVGYTKVNVPGENRQSVRVGLGFEF